MFLNENRIKLEINNWKISEKFSRISELNNIVLNNPWVKEKNLKKSQKYFEPDEN